MIWLIVLLFCFSMVFVFSTFETSYILCHKKGFVGSATHYKKFLSKVEEVITTNLVGLNFFAASSAIVALNFFRSLGLRVSLAVAISGIFISIVLILIEYTAKIFARRNPQKFLYSFVLFIKIFSYVAIPVNKLILLIILPLRILRGEGKKDAVEIINLVVTEAVRDGQFDKDSARLVLLFSRWEDISVSNFVEPLENYLKDIEELKGSFFSKDPILLKSNQGEIFLFDYKKYFLSKDLNSCLVPVKVFSSKTAVVKVVEELKRSRQDLCLIKTGGESKVFNLPKFLRKILED